jgi:hypothetical protein
VTAITNLQRAERDERDDDEAIPPFSSWRAAAEDRLMAKAFIILRLLGCATSVVDLASPLRRDECVRRLSEGVDDRWNPSGMRPIIGRISETSFTLRVRQGYRNSFRTLLRGTMQEESRQTRIHCRIGIDPFVRVFILTWLAIIALVAGAMMASAVSLLLHGQTSAAGSLAAILAPVGMLCFGIALTRFGRYLARDQQQDLIEFLTRRLDARTRHGDG